MRFEKSLFGLTTAGLLAALAAGCAAPAKQVKSSTDVIDGASAQAAPLPQKAEPTPAPAPAPAPAAPATCELSRVHFAFDSAQLDADAQAALRDAAACLQQRKAPELLIEGHCDERGTAAYNLALGSKRAAAVKSYLSDLGVKHIDTISFGKELPLVKGEGEAAWSQNRRAELRQQGEKRTDGVVVSMN
ncbi:MAG TPA: OmpA family protein [Anaeromyxobacteraceae bacterium]|nr:OmpA family protein [Anaeromyxobacteraceae bacterium]